MSHKSDVLLADEHNSRYVSLEIKHRSAVTDQFKRRAFDAIHMKMEYGSRLLAVLIYIKASKGISIEQARYICYPFDHFFDVSADSVNNPAVWSALISTIEAFIGQSLGNPELLNAE